MDIKELYQLAKWSSREIEGYNILEICKKFLSDTHKGTMAERALMRAADFNFGVIKDELIPLLNKIDTSSLTKSQMAILKSFEISRLLGEEGKNFLHRNLIERPYPPRLREMIVIIQRFHDGIEKLKQIEIMFEEILLEDNYEKNNEVLIRICFSGDASISNIKDLKDWGNAWHDIGRGIALAHGIAPEEIKIVGATSGSLILDLIANSEVALTFSGIIFMILKNIEKMYDIKKKMIEFKQMEINLDARESIISLLKKEIEAERLTEEQIKSLGFANANGEVKTALDKAIDNLYNFISKGGDTEFVVLENIKDKDKKEKDKYISIRENFDNIKRLEERIKLLEDNSKSDKHNE